MLSSKMSMFCLLGYNSVPTNRHLLVRSQKWNRENNEWRRSRAFTFSFEQIQFIALVLPLLTLSKEMLSGLGLSYHSTLKSLPNIHRFYLHGRSGFNPLTTNVSYHIETSQLICYVNQLTGFYMTGNIDR